MLVETSHTLKVDAPARFRTLKTSYGITASKSLAAHALAIAPTVNSIRPGVYQVGECVCDLWRMGCTCQQARNNKRQGIEQRQKPCAHFVALYLRGEWTPIDTDPVAYLKSVEVEQPEILALYARVPYPSSPYTPGKFITARIYEGRKDWIAELPSGEYWVVQRDEIKHVLPIYE